jgi:hypothetical protein
MNILISIDDTDNANTLGTGHLAAKVARLIETQGWGKTSFITRHQLFVHPDIPYTSHNSAMCFSAVIEPECRDALIDEVADLLVRESAPGSDPGLCVASMASMTDASALVNFGQTAKGSVLTKNDAYDLAQHLGIHLSEHGGTGQGVIGALAGAGLRLGGNDGRVRGGQMPPSGAARLTIRALLDLPEVDAVQTRDGDTLPDDTEIQLGDMIKTVMIGGRSTLLVTSDLPDGDLHWRICGKQELRCY